MIFLLLFIFVTAGVPVLAEAVVRPRNNLIRRSADEVLDLKPVLEARIWLDDKGHAIMTRGLELAHNLEKHLVGIALWGFVLRMMDEIASFISRLLK